MARDCGCSKPSGTPPGMNRRDFFKLAGVGAAGMLAPAGAEGASTPAPPGIAARALVDPTALKAWQDSLLSPSPPRLYHSGLNTEARLHLGGIGTGNIELGSDGQFTTWGLFNTLSDGYVPLHFGLRAGGKAALLQTAGGPDAPRPAHITMRGDYPIAELEYELTAFPVSISLRALTPMVPLDVRSSSMPAMHLRFRVRNAGDKPVPVSLAGFVLNPVGYEGQGSFEGASHPAVGGNVNRMEQSNGVTLLHMTAPAAGPGNLDRPVTLYSNRQRSDFGRGAAGLPAGLNLLDLSALPATTPVTTEKRVIWLDNPDRSIDPAVLTKIRDAVRNGAVLLLSSANSPLLQEYGPWQSSRPDPGTAAPGNDATAAAPRSDVAIDDFEGGAYHGWQVEGTAFGAGPSAGTEGNQQPVSGLHGHGLVNSFRGGDEPQGRMLSDPFTISRRSIRLLVGGGSSPETAVHLLVNDRVVRSASGHDNERLDPVLWDVSELQGQQARIEIVDHASGGWGHINVDDIVMTDRADDAEMLRLLSQLMPATFKTLAYTAGQVSLIPRAATGPPHTFPPTISLPGRLNFGGFHLIGGGAVLVQDAAGPLLMSRKVGQGECLFLAGPLTPPGGFSHTSPELWNAAAFLGSLAGGVLSIPSGQPADSPGYGDYALATTAPHSSVLLAASKLQDAWQAWQQNGNFEASTLPPQTPPTAPGVSVFGGVAAEVIAPAHGSVDVTFLFTWRLPNLYAPSGAEVGNHYATLWPDARAVAHELAADPNHVVERTEKFHSVFYDSTLPYWLLDATTSQAGILRHRGVVFRLAAGDIYGWEGSNGCCGPTCTHVWGYEQSLSALYPQLEREMRFVDFKHQQAPDGGIHNRTEWPSPPVPTGENPFADGHASCVLKAYREALNTTDAGWLTDYWPQIRKAVDHLVAMDAAGKEPDGIIEGDQPNTYDCSIHGANSFIGTYYLAALRAGEEMALRMGDAATAARYHQIFEMGSRNLVARCWNGEYFQQDLPGYMQGGSEYGPGCLSDQLIGQWWANLLGLGYLLPQDHVRKALASIFQYNWLPDMSYWHHNQRWFAGGKDRGLLVCTWPRGGRPDHPIFYCDEVWTGIEYEVASLMLHEGMITQGLSIARGVRDRYDGTPRPPMARNPWSELECGGHYARAMSSWGMLRTLSGFHYDGPNGRLSFNPQVTPERFSSFFTTAAAWGSLRQERTGKTQTNHLAVSEGQIALSHLELQAPSKLAHVHVTVDGHKTDTRLVRSPAGNDTPGETIAAIQFARPLVVRKGVEVRFSPGGTA